MTTRTGRLGNVLDRCGPLSLTALMALLIRAAPADDGDPEQEPKTATISGRVIDGDGKPVAPTLVTVWSFQPQPRRHWEMIAQPEATSEGAFKVSGLDAPGSYLIRGDVEGLAPGWMRLNLTEGGPAEAEIVVNSAGRVELAVRDADDRPIAGAWLRSMQIDGPNRSVWFGSEVIRDVDLPVPVSDKDGRLIIEDLPSGALLKTIVAHANFAPAEATEMRVERQPEPRMVTMPEGVPLILRVETPQDSLPIDEIEVGLYHEPLNHPSTIRYEDLPVRDGMVRVMIEPGPYTYLTLSHPEYFISPILSPKIVEQQFLDIDETNSTFRFTASPKIEIRGRLVDAASGEPIANETVKGEILNVGPDGAVPDSGPTWRNGDWGVTDANGWYSMELAAGKVRVSYEGKDFISESHYLEFDVGTDGSTEAPTHRLTPLAAVAGQVVGPDGHAAAGVVVRFRGFHLRGKAPVMTDDEGRFLLDMTSIPLDHETDERIAQHPVVAFHPQRPWVGVEWVQLDQPGSLSNVTVFLMERPGVDVTGLIPGEQTPWERGEWDQERLKEFAEVSLIGKPAPQLDGREWLNTPRPQMSLADFRGKYVLLDFWTTWCGPCHADLPSLKLLRKLYGGEHFEIIGVHDNSVTPEKIAEHVQKEGMEFPIVIDHTDGRILREYESHGIRGYPSYVLLGPDGRVLIDNRTAFGPTLWMYKLELVRELVLDAEGR